MGTKANILIIAGLGNPGAEYACTRHNAGFGVIDLLAERHDVRYWRDEAGCKTTLISLDSAAEHRHGEPRTIILAKPLSFMNTSGGPLSKLCRAHGIKADELLVIHDDVELAAGEIAYKDGGGLGGHNGLRSIAAKLGTQDFKRIRCGVGRPPGRMSVADFALKPLKGDELLAHKLMLEKAADLVDNYCVCA